MAPDTPAGLDLDAAAGLALWYQNLRETSNETFLPLFENTSRYLVLKGGGGSGKSVFAGRKLLERCVSEPGHRFLVCRKVARTLRESCFAQLRGQLAQHYPGAGAVVHRGELKLRFPNGSEILFAGLDDVEKLKSIYDITGIWIEEASELLERDFNQLDIRLRTQSPYYLQMILTFNPVSATHWLKARFFDRTDPRATVHESTYKDNRFLTQEAVRTLEAFRDTDRYYYTVYCLGQWGVTGKTVFDAEAISRRLALQIRPLSTGYFSYQEEGGGLARIQWVEDPQGFIKVYRRPEAGKPYVIGGDTAGDGSDFFVGQVLDNTTGEQVAVLRHRCDEDLFAKQMYCLGLWYNTALIGIETNWSTYPVLELERLRYPRQYVRERVDDYTHKTQHSFGFWTSAKTRPVILSGLIQAVREDLSLLHDRTTLEEMLTFVRDEHFRPAAQAGAHDDCVMALAIAHYIRPQQSCMAQTGPEKTAAWDDSMWEDYQNAGPEQRAYLIQKWGKPRR